MSESPKQSAFTTVIDVGFGAWIGWMDASHNKSVSHTALIATGASAVEQAISPVFGAPRSSKRFAISALTSTAAGAITHSLVKGHKENQYMMREASSCSTNGRE